MNWEQTPPSVGMPKVRELALQAIALDDSLAEAHNLLAKAFYYGDWDWPAAEREFRRAIELNPNYPFARMNYSLLLGSSKRNEEGMEQIERAVELDPLNLLWRTGQGWQFMISDRFGEAIDVFRETLSVGPVMPAQHFLWASLRHEGRLDEAWAEGKKTFVLRRDPEVVEALDTGYPESGYEGAMHKAAEILEDRSTRGYVQASMIARLYAHAGEDDQAMDWLQRAYEERDIMMTQLGVDPDWASLRADPRFRDLLERIGIPQ